MKSAAVIPLPQDASDPDAPDEQEDPFAPLKRTSWPSSAAASDWSKPQAAGFGEGRAAAPSDDWRPRRVGPDPPDSLGELRAQVEETVLSCCGVPPGLARAEGGESRESYRRWYAIRRATAGVACAVRAIGTSSTLLISGSTSHQSGRG